MVGLFLLFLLFLFKSSCHHFLGKDEVVIANKVLQFELVTDSGFRFALSHFAGEKCKPGDLVEKLWECVEWCLRAGFMCVKISSILIITNLRIKLQKFNFSSSGWNKRVCVVNIKLFSDSQTQNEHNFFFLIIRISSYFNPKIQYKSDILQVQKGQSSDLWNSCQSHE